MHSTGDRDAPVTVYVHRSRMRAYAQIVGSFLLGIGLAAAAGLDPGLLFAAYVVGTGVTPLGLGLLLPEDPGAAAGRDDCSCPSRR